MYLSQNKLTVHLDMDGVLSDFRKAAIELHGPNYEKLGRTNPVAFWRPITKQIDNFFSHLDPLPDALELYDFVSTIPDIDIKILTALPRPEGKAITVAQDKTDWIHRHIDDKLEVITVIGGKNKSKYCNAVNDILIDDTKRNLDAWEEAGGIGILHTSASETIKQLKDIFDL